MGLLLTVATTIGANAETADSILANKKIREQPTQATPPPAVTRHIWSKRAKSLPQSNPAIDQKPCQSYTKTGRLAR
jgi:hypothetical protein